MILPDIDSLTNDQTAVSFFARRMIHMDKEKNWAHIVTPESCPELDRIYGDCLQILGIKRQKAPRLVIYESHNHIADGVLDVDLTLPTIYLSNSLVQALQPEQLSFVIGHEGGHAKFNRRQFARLAGASGLAVFLGTVTDKWGISNKQQKFDPIRLAIIYLLLMVAARKNEYEADRCGIDIVKNPDIMQESFEKAANSDLQKSHINNRVSPDNILAILRSVCEDIQLSIMDNVHPSDNDRLTAAARYAEKKGYIGKDAPER